LCYIWNVTVKALTERQVVIDSRPRIPGPRQKSRYALTGDKLRKNTPGIS